MNNNQQLIMLGALGFIRFNFSMHRALLVIQQHSLLAGFKAIITGTPVNLSFVPGLYTWIWDRKKNALES